MLNVYADETEINSSKTLDDLFAQGTLYDFILFVTPSCNLYNSWCRCNTCNF